MKPESILTADVLDIIFENKNKAYGAYALRKYYHERMYRSLGIIFIAAVCATLISFFYKPKMISIPGIPEITVGTAINLPEDLPREPEQLKQRQKAFSTPSSKQPSIDQEPVIVDNTVQTLIPGTDDPGPINNDPGADPVSGPAGPGNGDPGPAQAGNGNAVITPVNRDMPVTADVMPAFPGGMDALRKFLQRNLINPADMEEGETVSVKVKFIVGYDGILKGFEITEDGGESFNNEVIRVLKKMPAWIPGKAHGENVSVYYYIPVKFTAAE